MRVPCTPETPALVMLGGTTTLGRYAPAAQVLQADAPAPEYDPFTHAVHTVSLVKLHAVRAYWPAPQTVQLVHTVLPVLDVYVPAAQVLQADTPAPEYDPFTHAVHTVAPANEL